MEETLNYHLNKPSLKDKSKIMPVIQNFSNIEIIVNRIILEMNEFIKNFNDSLTLDKINEFKLSLIEELKAIYLEKSTIDEIMNKIEELMTDKATLIDREEMKSIIIDFIQESYLSKQYGNNNYGLKSDYTESQRLENEGRKKLAQALNNQGIQTPLEADYDVISQNINKIQSFNNNILCLQEVLTLDTYKDQYTKTITSDTGGVIYFSPIESRYESYRVDEPILTITIDNNEPIVVNPADTDYGKPSPFYFMPTKKSNIEQSSSYSAGAFHFNKKVEILVEARSADTDVFINVYKWKNKESRTSKIKKISTKKKGGANKVKEFEFIFNGKGLFQPVFISRRGATGLLKLYIDENEPLTFFSFTQSELDLVNKEIEETEETYSFDKRMLEVFSNGYNIRKGFYIKKQIRIEFTEVTEDTSNNRELYYQFTPL